MTSPSPSPSFEAEQLRGSQPNCQLTALYDGELG